MYNDYQLRALDQLRLGNPVQGGSPFWSVANRISYVFDLHGPSMAVDTACSSSLSAIHLACQALAAGEARVAIAGGVNLSLHPSRFVALSAARFTSTDGRCRTFAAGGDGYVPSEGAAALILKPLAAAIADGDHVHAVIRGWSANHGGKTNGYTVPSPSRQAAAVGTAMRRAGVDPASISYVEAHGTGTSLGDPIEVAGSRLRLCRRTQRRRPCWFGESQYRSFRSRRRGRRRGQCGAGRCGTGISPRCPASAAPTRPSSSPAQPLRLQHEAAAWDGPFPRRAGISSFGAGGANAHLVIEEAPPRPPADTTSFGIATLSARTHSGLVAYAQRLAAAMDQPGLALGDVLYTLQHGREPMAARLAFVCDSIPDLRTRLLAFAAGDTQNLPYPRAGC